MVKLIGTLNKLLQTHNYHKNGWWKRYPYEEYFYHGVRYSCIGTYEE
jgi:hypothetical protein